MKYQEIKKEHEAKLNTLLTECLVFWAFSNQQFEEGKTPLQEGEKYVSIGAGGYMPKSKVEQFRKGMDDLKTWERNEIKKYKQADEQIKYELHNHECFYTGDITDVCHLLPQYSKERISKVYQAERKNAYQTV
jgi:hypothetical protein